MRSSSLRRKAFLLLVFLGLAPIVIVSLIEDAFVRGLVQKQVELVVSQSMDHLVFKVYQTLQSYINLVNNVSLNHQIVSSLPKQYVNDREREQASFMIRNEIFKSGRILSIQYPFEYYIVAADGTVFTNFTYIVPGAPGFDTSELLNSDWFHTLKTKKYLASSVSMEYGPHYLYPNEGNRIYFIQNIVHNYENVGAAVIGISYSSISRLLDIPELDSLTSVFLFDEERRLVVEGENEQFTADFIFDRGLFSREYFTASRNEKIMGKKYFLFSKHFSIPTVNARFQIAALSPCTSLYTSLSMVRYFYFIMIVCSLSAMIILITIIERKIIHPIIHLNEKVRQVQNGNFEGTLEPSFRENIELENRLGSADKSEIGELNSNFNLMVTSLREYIRDIREKEASRRTFEIKFLQSQMKPHFVRNTLATIRWMAQIRGAKSIGSAIASFTKMLDYLLTSTDELVHVYDEISYIEQYLYLQKIRFQNKLTVTMEIEESIENLLLPKLILQPIIENSLVHGSDPKKSCYNLTIKGYQDNEQLLFIIKDNGTGIDSQVLKTLMDKLTLPPETDQGHGIGLINMQKRIHFHFGRDYGLIVQNNDDEGVAVTVSLPLTKDIYPKERERP
jgi:two-component system, sensor histidine kinase YesM